LIIGPISFGQFLVSFVYSVIYLSFMVQARG
jgi:hypothetical protein